MNLLVAIVNRRTADLTIDAVASLAPEGEALPSRRQNASCGTSSATARS
jgi:hypothetical protein